MNEESILCYGIMSSYPPWGMKYKYTHVEGPEPASRSFRCPSLFSPIISVTFPIIRLQLLCSPIQSTTPKSRRLPLICNVGWLRRSTASALSCVIKTPTSRNGAAESSIRRDTNVVVGAFCFFSRFEMSVGDTLLSWLGITKTG